MLTLTDQAGAQLSEIIEKENLPENVAIRLVAEERGLSMRPDSARDDDATIEHNGRVVLLLDPRISDLLTENTLDVEEGNFALKGGPSAADDEEA